MVLIYELSEDFKQLEARSLFGSNDDNWYVKFLNKLKHFLNSFLTVELTGKCVQNYNHQVRMS